jgi:hypothetical protein
MGLLTKIKESWYATVVAQASSGARTSNALHSAFETANTSFEKPNAADDSALKFLLTTST